jgi:hypothetical protein
VNNAMRCGLVVGVVMVVLIGCSRAPTGEPTATASLGLPSAAPSSGPADATPGAVTDTLTGGRYAFYPFGDDPSFTVVATGPDRWVGYPDWALDGPEPLRAAAPNGIGITFFWANGVYSDPCHWDFRGTKDAGQPGDVGLGPTVDDLVTALRANTFYTSTAATPVTIDGYAGQELELQLPEQPDYATCDKDDPDDSGGHVFVFSGAGLYAQGQANRWHLYILDVEGSRLIAVILSYEGTSQADLDTAQSVIDTMDINP